MTIQEYTYIKIKIAGKFIRDYKINMRELTILKELVKGSNIVLKNLVSKLINNELFSTEEQIRYYVRELVKKELVLRESFFENDQYTRGRISLLNISNVVLIESLDIKDK